jgi:Raf kinase inhibitor-like YbhB/YbcL family protein
MRTLLISSLLLFSASAFAGGKFSLKSTDLKEGGKIEEKQVFNSFGCSGGNVSPELSWANAPAGTKSFALTVYDPDAPTGSGWWHWVVYNIPADTKELASGVGSGTGALPTGAVQGKTDFGSAGYGGPCPPQGDKPHHYIFTLYALKVDKLENVSADSSPAMIGFMLHANSLGTATLKTTYGRK